MEERHLSFGRWVEVVLIWAVVILVMTPSLGTTALIQRIIFSLVLWAPAIFIETMLVVKLLPKISWGWQYRLIVTMTMTVGVFLLVLYWFSFGIPMFGVGLLIGCILTRVWFYSEAHLIVE